MKTILLRIGAALIAIAALTPAGLLLYKSLHWEQQDQLEEIYFRTHQIQAAHIALLGLALAYVLLHLSDRGGVAEGSVLEL